MKYIESSALGRLSGLGGWFYARNGKSQISGDGKQRPAGTADIEQVRRDAWPFRLPEGAAQPPLSDLLIARG